MVPRSIPTHNPLIFPALSLPSDFPPLMFIIFDTDAPSVMIPEIISCTLLIFSFLLDIEFGNNEDEDDDDGRELATTLSHRQSMTNNATSKRDILDLVL